MAEPPSGGLDAANGDAEKGAPSPLEIEKLRWSIRVAKADFFQKILISIVGACVAAIFYLYQANQTQSRYYSDLQAQRERSDADLRAKMFDTLFQAYFKNKMEATTKGGSRSEVCAAAGESLRNLTHEIVLSDLLARNFEAVDVRPLFEDIDRRLSEVLHNCGSGTTPSAEETLGFSELEELRRAAIGSASRQTESLQSNAHAEVQPFWVEQCQSGDSAPEFFPTDQLPLRGNVFGYIKRIDEGAVTIELALLASASEGAPHVKGEASAPLPRRVPISVSFYDMPSLENVRLPDQRRLALTLVRLLSTRTCQRYSQQMDASLREDCDALLHPTAAEAARTAGKQCYRATLLMTLIPSDYIGPRDRPFLNVLSPQGLF
jgi:hypothetical protein